MFCFSSNISLLDSSSARNVDLLKRLSDITCFGLSLSLCYDLAKWLSHHLFFFFFFFSFGLTIQKKVQESITLQVLQLYDRKL